MKHGEAVALMHRDRRGNRLSGGQDFRSWRPLSSPPVRVRGAGWWCAWAGAWRRPAGIHSKWQQVCSVIAVLA